MILVIDSGATNMEWRLLKADGSIEQGKQTGFHPLFQTDDQLKELMEQLVKAVNITDLKVIYYYGTGCAGDREKARISDVIVNIFNLSEIHVETDLLGAARGLCGRNEGIACILGTGSNSCHYDGEKITDRMPPLGYLLGDEGGGSYLGKRLITAFCRHQLPGKIEDSFVKRFGFEKEDVPQVIYQNELPQQFLGSFSKFLLHHKSDPTIYQIIVSSFDDFFSLVTQYYDSSSRLSFHFSGSIAFYFNDILRRSGKGHKVTIGSIVENPIAGLTLFHQGEI